MKSTNVMKTFGFLCNYVLLFSLSPKFDKCKKDSAIKYNFGIGDNSFFECMVYVKKKTYIASEITM